MLTTSGSWEHLTSKLTRSLRNYFMIPRIFMKILAVSLLIDQHHVLFKVKVRSGNRGLSTLKFNTTESLNAGRGDPTQRQMQRWIENIISEPSSDDEDDTDSDNGVDCPVFERDVEVTSSGMPFLENLCIQAKDINFGPKNKGKTDALRKGYDQGRIEKLTKHFWDVFGLPEYITAFSKIATGGSVYFGVEEDTKHREFKCNGFRLTENDRREMKRSIERKVCDTMLWVGLSPPKNPVIVKFPTVITREADWYVVEVKVNYLPRHSISQRERARCIHVQPWPG
ncbi:hypothetical protein BaRGS_00018239 [Batillaria attramentaria]|uniref:Uncharacterized protein n=1 Tax=Batillaria attramentaria TaxID=370345 RepID=A0ABD0KTW7_9CAEN